MAEDPMRRFAETPLSKIVWMLIGALLAWIMAFGLGQVTGLPALAQQVHSNHEAIVDINNKLGDMNDIKLNLQKVQTDVQWIKDALGEEKHKSQ